MHIRRLALHFLLATALLFGASASFAAEPVAPDAVEPTVEAPSSWMGTASGMELLWIPGHRHGKGSPFDMLEMDVQVDESDIGLLIAGESEEWTGTMALPPEDNRRHRGFFSRYLKRHRDDKHRVTFDDPSVEAMGAYLAARIAAKHGDSSVDAADVGVGVSRYRVSVDIDAVNELFTLSGSVYFRIDDPSRRHKRGGLYMFRLRGAIEEVEPIPEEPPVPAGPVRVLLLGDNRSQAPVETAMLAAGYEVTTFTRYTDWDGITPSIDQFDVAVYLDGFEYGRGLLPAADAALDSFVRSGGGLVRTEWSSWVGTMNPMTDPHTPLIANGGYRDGSTWMVTMPSHPLVAGVAPTWYDPGSIAYGQPAPGATVVAESDDGWPLVTFGQDSGGTVVHINNALTYGSRTMDPNTIQLLVNAASFAAGR
jgi:hypothetical protein